MRPLTIVASLLTIGTLLATVSGQPGPATKTFVPFLTAPNTQLFQPLQPVDPGVPSRPQLRPLNPSTPSGGPVTVDPCSEVCSRTQPEINECCRAHGRRRGGACINRQAFCS